VVSYCIEVYKIDHAVAIGVADAEAAEVIANVIQVEEIDDAVIIRVSRCAFTQKCKPGISTG
jgi:hypothetical protein